VLVDEKNATEKGGIEKAAGGTVGGSAAGGGDKSAAGEKSQEKAEKKKKVRLQNALYLDDELPDSRLNGSKYNRERYKQFRHIDAMVAYYEEKKLKK
jgi:hypothetical protein